MTDVQNDGPTEYVEYTTNATAHAVIDIVRERARQNGKWGIQHHPDGTFSTEETRWQRELDRDLCQDAAAAGVVTWRHILQEEVSEALAETIQASLRSELVQVAAVCAAWIEDIDSRA